MLFVGYGREKGGIVSLLHNNHPTQDLLVVYMEVIPWFLRVYLHTLTIETFTAEMKHIGINGTALQPCETLDNGFSCSCVIIISISRPLTLQNVCPHTFSLFLFNIPHSPVIYTLSQYSTLPSCNLSSPPCFHSYSV